METLTNKELRQWNRFVQNLRIDDLTSLRKKFGDDLKKPTPEDFGLSTNKIPEIEIENERIEVYNRKQEKNRYKFEIGLAALFTCVGFIIIFGYIGIWAFVDSFFLWLVLRAIIFNPTAEYFFPIKAKSSIGRAFDTYKKNLSEYPEEEILRLKEEERLLEIRKRAAEYWFSLDGHQFEEEMATLFKKSGHFNVIKTKGSGDGGVDLILTATDGTKILVQCKAHKGPVGPSIARDLFGAMHHEHANRGIIVSLGGVTEGVRDFIDGKNITIVDVDGVIKMHKMLQ